MTALPFNRACVPDQGARLAPHGDPLRARHSPLRGAGRVTIGEYYTPPPDRPPFWGFPPAAAAAALAEHGRIRA